MAGVGKLFLRRATLKILVLSEVRIYILSASWNKVQSTMYEIYNDNNCVFGNWIYIQSDHRVQLKSMRPTFQRNCSQFWIMFLNCGTSLLLVIHMTAFKLQSVSIDLFFDLFIFRQKKTKKLVHRCMWNQTVTKVWQQSFLREKMML